MRNVLTLCLFLAYFSNAYIDINAQGINFVHDTTLTQLKQRAKRANKPIFIDCYTSWCGPCKWMAKNIFPNDTVGDFYNSSFICAKIDMEKGDGKNIANTYKIRSYPSFLFLDTSGKEIHRFIGSQPAIEFVENGKNAIDTEKQWGTLRDKYKSGDRSHAFLRKYILAAYSAGEDPQPLVDWYAALLTPAQIAEPETFLFFSKVSYYVRTPLFEQLCANRAAYIKQYGSAEVSKFIKGYLEREVQKCYEMREITPHSGRYKIYELPEKYKAFIEKIKSIEFDGKEEYLQTIQLNSMLLREDVPELLAYYKKNPSGNSDKLNSVAWIVYEKSDKPEELKQALQLSKKSIELDEIYANVDTYAALLYKLGKKKDAQKYAEKAIELAKKENREATATLELLEKIKAMK
ncbi:MAG: thioredoxin family protein [Flavobacteriales bacterium]